MPSWGQVMLGLAPLRAARSAGWLPSDICLLLATKKEASCSKNKVGNPTLPDTPARLEIVSWGKPPGTRLRRPSYSPSNKQVFRQGGRADYSSAGWKTGLAWYFVSPLALLIVGFTLRSCWSGSFKRDLEMVEQADALTYPFFLISSFACELWDLW